MGKMESFQLWVEQPKVFTIFCGLTILSVWTQNLGSKLLQANSQTAADLLRAIGFGVKGVLCDPQHFLQTDPECGLHLL